MHENSLLPPLDIPDLSTLPAQSEWIVVARAMAGAGSADQTSFTLQMNCVRLLDASIKDYTLGRDSLLRFHARGENDTGIDSVVQATTHFESCLWHFERFLKHARALRSAKNAEPELKALIPRNLSFFAPAAERAITDLRDALAHLEKDALGGRLPPGTSIALMPSAAGLTIGVHTMSWDDLARWLSDAYECVTGLSRYSPR